MYAVLRLRSITYLADPAVCLRTNQPFVSPLARTALDDQVPCANEIRASMDGITPWVSVEPLRNPGAILGPLPMVPGVLTTFAIPSSVVPARAAGILVFAWASIAGVNGSGVSFWHFAVNIAARRQNFFSLLVEGRVESTAACVNSQAFWLPMPGDGKLQVTLFGAALPSPLNHGEVEIHGYYPAVG